MTIPYNKNITKLHNSLNYKNMYYTLQCILQFSKYTLKKQTNKFNPTILISHWLKISHT